MARGQLSLSAFDQRYLRRRIRVASLFALLNVFGALLFLVFRLYHLERLCRQPSRIVASCVFMLSSHFPSTNKCYSMPTGAGVAAIFTQFDFSRVKKMSDMFSKLAAKIVANFG